MSAFVKHTFEKGFILDEERIRKINEMLTARGVQVNPSCKPVYRVYRADTFSYTTEDIQVILNEDNSEWQKILQIEILMEYSDEFRLELDFNEDETYLDIQGNDRDVVFLIFSELRQYLTNEVNRINLNLEKFSSSSIVGVGITTVFALMIAMMLRLVNLSKTSISYDAAVASKDLELKFNYLIESTRPRDTTVMFYYVIPMLVIFMLMMIFAFARKSVTLPIRYLYPGHLFLFGKEVQKHAKRLTLRQNMLWGVIVASIISIVTGLIVWLITKNVG